MYALHRSLCVSYLPHVSNHTDNRYGFQHNNVKFEFYQLYCHLELCDLLS